MNKKFLIIGVTVILGLILMFEISRLENSLDVNNTTSEDKIKLDIESLFDIYGLENDFEIKNGERIWKGVRFELNPNNNEIYKEIRNESENIVVIFPIFTAAAYNEPGFYTYFRGECNEKCLTIELKREYPLDFVSSENGIQVLSLLGYNMITDVDVDKNPEILKNFDKVILLHNEYVTRVEFDAITSHPNVIYLYPNALYAEIKTDYENNSITLLRGHNFPNNEIQNGFDWEFDNSKFEYNTSCEGMGFDKVDNGWMLNCYPENAIHKSKVLLKMIKDF